MSCKKQLKQQLKIFMNEVADKLKSGRLSSKSLGIIIRTIHVFSPIIFLFALLFGSYLLSTITIVCLFAVLLCFYTFDCCFLSVLEQNLCNDDFVIVDPALELFDYEINSYNRYYISNVLGLTYMAIVCSIYYIRFYRK